MFSSTAYEAYYTYIGIHLHQASIGIITSQVTFIAILMLILGWMLIMGAWRFVGKYFPGAWGRSGGGGPGFLIKILACFVLAVSLLKVSTEAQVKDFKRNSWADNGYISQRLPINDNTYKVSFLFDLLVRSAEEVSKLANEVVDKLFAKTNSQLEAPSAFYRAILFAGSQTISDPDLREQITVYTNSCFETVLPLMGKARQQDKIDEFFRDDGRIDQELELVPLEDADGELSNCLVLKITIRNQLWAFAQERGAKFSRFYSSRIGIGQVEYTDSIQRNLIASGALMNHYLSQTEDTLGTQKGSKVEGTIAQFLQGWDRLWSFNGILSLFGQQDKVGAALTAERAAQFSEYLQRAPHLKGMVKMFLIALFPWLVFFIVAGRWKILIAWFAVYCSVLLWTPIWNLLYHLMTSIALSNEMMQQFGRVSDGISLYSSSIITAKLYQFYAIYSWLQLLLGPLPTVILGYSLLSSLLRDSQPENTPTVVTTAKDAAIAGASGGPAAAASSVLRK